MIERLKRGGRRPPRLNCIICGDSDLYPRQCFCRKCYAKQVSDEYQAKQLMKAKSYPIPTDLEGEEWKELKEVSGYLVSSHGRVKCMNYRRQQRSAILKLSESRRGSYLKVDIDKNNYRPLIHILVATYFVPNPLNYPMVLHKDNNKQNNHKDNLEWGTASKNRLDYIEYTNKIGLKRTKMNKEKVMAIFNSSETVQAIAIKYEITTSTVWMIKTGYRHSSITGLESTDKRHKK